MADLTLGEIAYRFGTNLRALEWMREAAAKVGYPFPRENDRRQLGSHRMLYCSEIVDAWWAHHPRRDLCDRQALHNVCTAQGELRLATYLHFCGCRDQAERVYRHARQRHGQDVIAGLLLEDVRRRFNQLNPDYADEIYEI